MADLPTGTVTITLHRHRGSTRLQQLSDAHADVPQECRRVVRTAVQGRGGQEVDREGDTVSAAFPSVRQALLAAVTAQHILLGGWDRPRYLESLGKSDALMPFDG